MRSCLLQNVYDELPKLIEVKCYGSSMKIEKTKSARVQTIVSWPAKNQTVVANKNLQSVS